MRMTPLTSLILLTPISLRVLELFKYCLKLFRLQAWLSEVSLRESYHNETFFLTTCIITDSNRTNFCQVNFRN